MKIQCFGSASGKTDPGPDPTNSDKFQFFSSQLFSVKGIKLYVSLSRIFLLPGSMFPEVESNFKLIV